MLHTPAVPKLLLILKESASKVAEVDSEADKVFEHILSITRLQFFLPWVRLPSLTMVYQEMWILYTMNQFQ
jgi:hypothetical protein